MKTSMVIVLILLHVSLCGAQENRLETADRGSENDIFHQMHKGDSRADEAVAENEVVVSTVSRSTNLSDLSAAVTSLTLLVEELKRENAEMKTQVDSLMRENTGRKVAFSASFFASGSGYMGPYSGSNNQITLVFRHVITNVGNAYNPGTGAFTAPVRGVYSFKFHLFGFSSSSHYTAAALVKNGRELLVSSARQASYEVNSSNGATLLLEEGDVVNLRPWSSAYYYDDQHHRCSFSGHLLFTL